MKRKTTISLLIALSLILLQIPASKGTTDEWKTDFVDEDLFIASYPFEGVDMIYLQGDGMRIIGYYWFEGPVMDWGRYIKEAYLEIYVPSAMAPDPDAIMEIYGKPSGKGGTPSYAEDPGVVNGPYTTNFYQVNLSSFVGAGTLYNITVTRILREINQGYYFWNGHDIAFVTRAHDGHDEERSIASLESGHPAKLYIHYGQPDPGDPEYPPWLTEGMEFVEDYRNYTIWKETVYLNSTMSYFWDNLTGAAEGYFHSTYGRGLIDNTDRDLITEPGNFDSGIGFMDQICRIEDSIFIMQDFGEVEIWYSHDEGATWANLILNDQYTDLTAHAVSSIGSMSLDENGTIHMTWGTYTDTYPAQQVQVYSNFTVLSNGTLNFYDGFTEWGNHYTWENIEADKYGRVHIAYVQGGDLKYRMRFINGTWSGIETIEDTDTLGYPNIDVADMPGDYPLARFVFYRVAGVGFEDVWETIRYPNGTLAETLLETFDAIAPASANDIQGNCSWAVWVIGDGNNQEVKMQGYNFTTETLLAKQDVSSTVENHRCPDIGIGEDGYGYITWYSDWHIDFWGRRFDLDTGNFIEPRQRIIDYNLAGGAGTWAQITPWNEAAYANTTYYIADMNGTLIDTFTITDDTNGTQEAEDFVDEDIYGYPDPEDPDPPGWEDSIFTANQFKLGLFLVGLIMFLGAPIYGFAERPEAATWIIILFTSLCGVALLWSLQTM